MTLKRKLVGTLCAAFILTLAAGVFIGRTTLADAPPVAGSTDDPIVTQSYVDAKIQAALAKLPTGNGSTGSGSTTPAATGGFQVVDVPGGKTVVASTANGLEVIVRSGTVQAVTLNPNNGIADLTSGANQTEGNVGLNHYLILAKNDGRGLQVTTNDSFMMIRGAYNLQ
ncbi:MAG: hypothetical protein JWN30_244 [Bacilli bacterium]|nr:hypothetical protein [Bacilli bacterium]